MIFSEPVAVVYEPSHISGIKTMDLELKGHVALVQGASKGIGRGIAESLAAEGCHLFLTARSHDPLKKTAEEIAAKHGVRVHFHQADSANLSEIPSLLKVIETDFGRLDIIVCNSGGPPAGGIKDLTPEQWSEAGKLLLAAPAYMLQLALPLLRRSPAPRFFIVTSSSTRVPVAGLTLSNTFRPGIVGLIKSLTDELAADRVCCHSIAPGRFDTDRLSHLIKVQSEKFQKTQDQVRDEMVAAIPAGRLGDVADIGNLVAFLSARKSDYLRGGNWLVDGGLVKGI
ncbi:SDR family oxidoreductase [Candidatus Sumerlaeota bacterium]|nr:SDR family oxidoreductase [Candidatus Sumerlaeota bacterium]